MVDDDGARISAIGLCGDSSEPARGRHDFDLSRAVEGSAARSDGFIAVIESRAFLRECLNRSIQSMISLPVITYSTVSELERQPWNASAQLVILSLVEGSEEDGANSCKVLSELLPKARVIVLADRNDQDLARTVMTAARRGSSR